MLVVCLSVRLFVSCSSQSYWRCTAYLPIELDLFSFDAPAPAQTGPTATVAPFDAFSSAPAPTLTAPSNGFDAFQSTPAALAPSDGFDAFQSMPAPVTPAPSANGAFGAFENAGQQQPVMAQQQSTQFGAFRTQSATGLTNNMAPMNSSFGNMQIQQQPMGGFKQPPTSVMSGSMQVAQNNTNSGGDDDFGDFEDAASSKKLVTSSDPMSRLISLDSLSKNETHKSKLNDPIVASPAAAQYIQNQQQMQQQGVSTKVGDNPEMSFRGIDGLTSQSNFASTQPTSNLKPGQSVMGSSSNAGGADAIAMLSPGNMGMGNSNSNAGMMQGQQNMTPQQQQMMMQHQMMLKQQQMMMQQQGGGVGMENPNMMGMQGQGQAGMHPNMMMQQNNLGMQQNGMQGRMMDGQSQMQGGMGMNGMNQQQGGNMVGGNGMDRQAGGQPMGGQWQ